MNSKNDATNHTSRPNNRSRSNHTPRPNRNMTPRPNAACCCNIQIDEDVIKEIINSVLNSDHVDQEVAIYSPRAAKILSTAEMSFPQANKNTIACYLVENMFPCGIFRHVWDRVAMDIPETNIYETENIQEVIETIKMGPEYVDLLKSVEEKIENNEISPYITIHSPRLVASLNYIGRTMPKFKKEAYVASILSEQAIVNLGEDMYLDIFF